ncbi:ABC transporter ATP-binding protein, partial [Coprococcus sp. MSK.21.13]|nr:ABC transporter ATP-binding protein [Coprococcus sp. MSK.21.13]
LIIITHDLNIASQADRIITVEDGCIVKDEVMKA